MSDNKNRDTDQSGVLYLMVFITMIASCSSDIHSEYAAVHLEACNKAMEATQ